MAILIRGKTICRLCGRIIGEADPVVMFPAFVSNELDPLRVLDDGAFHSDCFARQPLAVEAIRRYQEYQAQPAPPVCAVCGESITSASEYVDVGHLTSDSDDPLYKFNYLRFHRAHLPTWPKRDFLYRELAARIADGSLKSRAYDLVLDALRDAARN